jgi:uncharacterized protein YbcI
MSHLVSVRKVMNGDGLPLGEGDESRQPARRSTVTRTTEDALLDSVVTRAKLVFTMDEQAHPRTGDARATIAREIVRLQSEYYGKGPTKARTYIVDDIVAVVLQETFTKAEKTLVERGEREAVQHIRRRFQQQLAEQFTSVVEQATGRVVKSFMSETDVEADISVEFFVLGEARTQMEGFEGGGEG